MNYENIQWVVQQNLTNQKDLQTLVNACATLGITAIPIDIVPFTPLLPAFDRSKKSIFYGSTTFAALVGKDPSVNAGLFFNHDHFSMQNYLEKWGQYMLNADAVITTFKDLQQSEFDAEKSFFIRPDDD